MKGSNPSSEREDTSPVRGKRGWAEAESEDGGREREEERWKWEGVRRGESGRGRRRRRGKVKDRGREGRDVRGEWREFREWNEIRMEWNGIRIRMELVRGGRVKIAGEGWREKKDKMIMTENDNY